MPQTTAVALGGILEALCANVSHSVLITIVVMKSHNLFLTMNLKHIMKQKQNKKKIALNYHLTITVNWKVINNTKITQGKKLLIEHSAMEPLFIWWALIYFSQSWSICHLKLNCNPLLFFFWPENQLTIYTPTPWEQAFTPAHTNIHVYMESK